MQAISYIKSNSIFCCSFPFAIVSMFYFFFFISYFDQFKYGLKIWFTNICLHINGKDILLSRN